MEYLVGSLSTFFIIFFMSFSKNKQDKEQKVTVRYSQSHIFELVRPLLPPISNKMRKNRVSQSTEYDKKTNIRVIIVEDTAYWIKNNVFYKAEIVDGSINSDSTEIVDTISMNKVQLDKMLFIMDRLREGVEDDSGSAGN